jgi:hypothetical protein
MLAYLLSRPAVVDYLIRRAKRTPYRHITGPDGTVYMERYWLFNPYPAESSGQGLRFPISVRLHRIMREDQDRALHDHPWNARTFILRGDYTEVREDGRTYWRRAGDTARLRFGEFHQITSVSDGGVWTLFVTGKYRGTWGFLVDGVKVQWRKYLGLEA